MCVRRPHQAWHISDLTNFTFILVPSVNCRVMYNETCLKCAEIVQYYLLVNVYIDFEPNIKAITMFWTMSFWME